MAAGMQEQDAEPAAKPKRIRRAKTAPAELATAEGAAAEDAGEGEEAPKKKRRGKGPDPNAFGEDPPVMSCQCGQFCVHAVC
jgi:hypothetical protein